MSHECFCAQWGSIDERVRGETIEEQQEVEASCAKTHAAWLKEFPAGSTSAPVWREDTIHWLRMSLRTLPGRFAGLESSMPWLCYWMLHSLELLDGLSSIPVRQLESTVDFLLSLQHPAGGFCGAPGLTPHVLSTYAATLALCILARELDCFASVAARVNRAGLRRFLDSIKVPRGDENYGGFRVCEGGECDTRALFGAAISASLWDVLRDDWEDPAGAAPFAESVARGGYTVLPPGAACALLDGAVEWVCRCQTFEGGIAGEPGNEAHGGYAFCGFAVLMMLGAPDAVDIDALLKWAAQRQHAFEGGFSGRSNKLADSCYSFWIGILFPLVHEAKSMIADKLMLSGVAFAPPPPAAAGPEARARARAVACALETPNPENGWLFDQRALQTFILGCCQDPRPAYGLRDKPGKGVDFYHTCYALSGLSLAQHSLSSVYRGGARAKALAADRAAAFARAAGTGAGAQTGPEAAGETAGGSEHDSGDEGCAAAGPAQSSAGTGESDGHIDPAQFAAFGAGFTDAAAPVPSVDGDAFTVETPLTIGSESSLVRPMHRLFNIAPAAVADVFSHWAERACAAVAAGAISVEADDD